MLGLAWRMLRRDLRAGELTLLFAALVLAVASLVSVGFLADRVGRALEREATQLLGGDLLLRADQPWSEDWREAARARGLMVTDSILFNSMVGTAERTELAGAKVVAEGYPLRGVVKIAPGPNQPGQIAAGIPAPGEVWLDERLFAALSVKVGDQVALGERDFVVAAMITDETDRGSNFFSLLPRVIFNVGDLPATGLIGVGTRASWRLHVAGSADAVADFQRWATGRMGRGQALETLDNARPEVRAMLDQAQRFLRLAALLAVILAAVAVGLSARRFMARHLDGCAVMRCLGARQAQLLRLFLIEFLLLALAAALCGALLGAGLQAALAGVVDGLLRVPLPAPGPLPVLHGIVLAVVLLAGFALPPLLRLARVPTLRVLRREWLPVAAAGRWLSAEWLAWAAGAASLAGLIVWIAGDPGLGLRVAASFALALAGFALLAWGALGLLVRRDRRLVGSRLGAGGWAYGLAALRRRIGGSVVQATALGLGLCCLLLLTLVRADLLETWQRKAPADAPNRFMINIQPDQLAALRQDFAEAGLAEPQFWPMIRGRMVAINGEPIDPARYTDRRTRRLAEREFNLSHGAQLPEGNRLRAGRWHGEGTVGQWSVEAGLAETFGLKLGDRVRFEIGGQPVEATIGSIRQLDWDSMRVNFFFIASPGLLDAHPASLITSFYLPAEQAGFVTTLVQRHPNLTVIDVSAMLAQVQALLDKLVFVVQAVFGFALFAGLIVLQAALQATHDEREFEMAMLRTLGASRAQLRAALLAEFGVLGAVAGLLGGVGASLIGWGLAEQAFNLSYTPALMPVAVGALAGAGLVIAGGWFGVRHLLGQPPLASLRALG